MKTVKRATACLLVVVLCLSLCSCNALDEMRAAHAILREDGTILWNNAEYRPLSCQDELVWGRYPLEFDDDVVQVNVTDESVPVLLSRQFGRYGVSYNEHTILHGGSYFYCLSSQYGKVTKELQEIQELVELNGGGYADSYYYNYWYENDGVENSQTYYLTDEQVDAVNTVLTTVEPILPEEDLGMSWNVVLYSEDLKYFEANLALDARNNRYFFSNVNGNDAIYYLVPEEYTAIFDEIFFAKWDALGIDTENWPSRDEQKGEDTL